MGQLAREWSRGDASDIDGQTRLRRVETSGSDWVNSFGVAFIDWLGHANLPGAKR
jgi:hypothetical protein